MSGYSIPEVRNEIERATDLRPIDTAPGAARLTAIRDTGVMTRRQLFLVLFGSLLATACLAQTPNIELRDLDGRTRNVNTYIGHGQWVVVVAWAHDCAICEGEIHEMSAFHAAHRKRDAIVLGVSIDGFKEVQAAREFVARNRLPFVNLIAEPRHDVMEKFGAGRFVGTPTYYIYNPQGEIAGQNIGPLTRVEVENFLASFNNARHDNQ